VLIPGSFDNIIDSSYGQVGNLEDFFHLEVDTINMASQNMGKLFDGSAAARPNQDCFDLFIVNTNVDCPTEWFMADIIISKKYTSPSVPQSLSPGAKVSPSRYSVGFFSCVFCGIVAVLRT